MRILQICPGAYQSGRGGISEHVVNISERLARRHDVTVYATNPAGSLCWSEVVNEVNVRRFKRFSPSGSYFFSPNMITSLRENCFDVVHGHGYHAFPMHFASLAKHRKLVLSTHFHGAGHTTLRDCFFRLFKPIGKMSLKNADRVVAVSEFEKCLLCRSFGLDSSKVVVVPNGLDLDEFINLKHSKSACRSILYVGRLERYKGVQYLVEVLSLLEEDITLKIVGNGSLREILEKRARKLGVQDRVFFFKNLPRKELLRMYVDANVFALLSEYEAYSIAVAEALVVGTPCVVTDTSALSEWIDNDSCLGVNVPVRLGELSMTLRTAMEKARTKSVKDRVGKKIFDWCDVVLRLEDLYAA